MARGVVYPKEFKESIIQMALQGNTSIVQVAKEYEVHEKTLYGWISEYKRGAVALGDKDGSVEEMQTQIKQLKKENAQLKMERDILKKATAYFAKQTK